MKLTVTCECGKEVAVPVKIAGALLANSRTKKRDPIELRATAVRAAKARWCQHVYKVSPMSRIKKCRKCGISKKE